MSYDVVLHDGIHCMIVYHMQEERIRTQRCTNRGRLRNITSKKGCDIKVGTLAQEECGEVVEYRVACLRSAFLVRTDVVQHHQVFSKTSNEPELGQKPVITHHPLGVTLVHQVAVPRLAETCQRGRALAG